MLRLCLAAVALLISSLAAEPGFRAQYVGGTLASVAPKANLRLDLTHSELMVLKGGGEPVEIAFRKIHSVEYGQTVGRRYAAAILISPVLLLSKSRKHYVTLGYEEGGRQQAIVLRVEKGDIRSLLASLEARTGRRIEYQDNEARKGAK